ncbi:unnamed protein product [Owenia fusiformis]|uniref:Uncharacterized protein n=1 Tax=Owenia fusiformis TaxID=6347 RepID=A0A8S4QC76_OWEFU|nr:unnamed protein product [Owenia fusiformis]
MKRKTRYSVALGKHPIHWGCLRHGISIATLNKNFAGVKRACTEGWPLKEEQNILLDIILDNPKAMKRRMLKAGFGPNYKLTYDVLTSDDEERIKQGESIEFGGICSLLHIAASFIRPGPLEVLVKMGADVNALDNEKTPLEHLVEYWPMKWWSASVDGDNIYRAFKLGIRASKCVNILLKNNATEGIFGKDYGHEISFLHYQVERGVFLNNEEFLKHEQFDIDVTNEFGETPLMVAARRCHDDIVKKLIDKNAKVGATDNAGNTALHHAVATSREETSQIVLTVGILLSKEDLDINQQNNEGNTAAHINTLRGDFSVTNMLLRNGANPDLTNSSGKSVFRIYIESMRSDNLMFNPARPITAFDVPDVDLLLDKTTYTRIFIPEEGSSQLNRTNFPGFFQMAENAKIKECIKRASVSPPPLKTITRQIIMRSIVRQHNVQKTKLTFVEKWKKYYSRFVINPLDVNSHYEWESLLTVFVENMRAFRELRINKLDALFRPAPDASYRILRCESSLEEFLPKELRDFLFEQYEFPKLDNYKEFFGIDIE